MSSMGTILPDGLQWYAMRMVAPGDGHRRTAMIGGDLENYRDRKGRQRQRRKPGTGQRIFVPEHILRRRGFSVFLPKKLAWCRTHRFATEKQLVAYPLVADWLFVGWPLGEARWGELRELGVVSGVLGAGGRPCRVRAKTMASMMDRWGQAVPPALHRAVRAQAAQGDQVEAIAGPFEGFSGEVVDAEGDGARVMLRLFGRLTPVALQQADLTVRRRSASEPVAVEDGALDCLRCAEQMVLARSEEKNHHLCCTACGAVAALNSSSEERAIANYRRVLSCGPGQPVEN